LNDFFGGIVAQYRYLAKERLKKSGTLLSSGDADDLIYACLELRKCIEALSYELLTGYLAEVPLKVIEVWQPDKVMRELLRIDSGADQTTRIRMKLEGKDGEPDGEWQWLGEDRRMKAPWGTKAYHQLGSYLHVPTIKQERTGALIDLDIVRKRANEIHQVLTGILDATIWNANFAVSVTFSCSNCEAPIKRRDVVIENGDPIECGNCGQLYDAEDRPNDSYFFVPHSFSWDCKVCSEHRSIMQVHAKDGADVSCPKCGDHVTLKLEQCWVLDRKDDAGSASA
jgi:predicted RNA-binding Zn-ribbon protein involved in translation (DUF1610 family)